MLNTKDWGSISTTDILNSSRSEHETNAVKLPRLKHSERVKMGKVNINLLRNKTKLLREMFWDKVDVLIISEKNFIHLFLRRSSIWNHSQKHTDLVEVTKGLYHGTQQGRDSMKTYSTSISQV